MKIQVSITLNEENVSGSLVKVSGGGMSAMFHLMIENYYYGRLRYSDFQKQWVFDTNGKETDIAYLFPRHVTDLANQGKLFNS